MFINVEDRLQRALTNRLDPGEAVLAYAFGLHTVSRQTARWILMLGLFVAGLFLLGVINDKVFVVLTNRRLLIIRLTPKGLYASGYQSCSRSGITQVEYDKGSLYHNLQFLADGRFYRFKFSSVVANFPNAGSRAQQLANSLTQLSPQPLSTGRRPQAVTAQPASGHKDPVQVTEKMLSSRPARRGLRIGLVLVAAPLVLLLGGLAVFLGLAFWSGVQSETLRHRAKQAAAQADFQTADRQFRAAIDAVGRWSKPDLYCELAEMWSDQRELQKASEIYREGIQHSAGPDLPALYHGLILLQVKMGKLPAAQETHANFRHQGLAFTAEQETAVAQALSSSLAAPDRN